jgi:tricorn protease
MMKFLYIFGLIILWSWAHSLTGSAKEVTSGGTRLLRMPSVSDDHIVFTYANDLWLVPRAGGKARQLTSHPGAESFGRLSPDGRWLTFTAQYAGDYDIYLMPSSGGEPKRLTYYPGYDQALGWTPDSKRVLFYSRRASIINPVNKLFTVGLEGGFPEELPLPDTGLASFSPDGTRLAYNRISTEYRNWKRYRGGRQSYVSIYSLKTNRYEEIPHTDASDLSPMWYENTIYFASDRSGIMNLYRYDLPSKRLKQLTNYREFEVKYPSLGGLNSPAIIYENGGYLYTFDIKTETIAKVLVKVEGDLPQTNPRVVDAANYISTFGLSSDGERAVFGARGEVFTISQQNKAALNLTRTSGVNELQPVWSPDGKWIAYFSDRSGEYEVYVRASDGSGAERRITTRTNGYLFNPVWSPDSNKLLFTDNTRNFFYVDINDTQAVLIDQSRNGDIYNYTWSPDSRWVAYPKATDNLFRQIHVYSIGQKKSYPVTDGRFDDRNPVFDPAGQYLYFLSTRNYRPGFFFEGRSDTDWGINYNDTTGIYVVTLTAAARSPFAAGAKNDGPPRSVRIDFENINHRIVNAPIPLGNYTNLRVNKKRLFYLSRPSAGTEPANALPTVLRSYNFDSQAIETLMTGNQGGFHLSATGDKIIYLLNGFRIIEALPNQKPDDGALDLSGMKMTLDPRAEWNQIFEDAWRIERDFYYDPDLHGVDWFAMKKRYEPLLPFVAHREDLNYLIGEMIGELGTSHLFANGGDMPNFPRTNVGLLGTDFEIANDLYRFKKIYRGDNSSPSTRSPLSEPGILVREGEYMLAVNGKPLRAGEEPYSFFENTVGKDVILTINDKPVNEGARNVTVRPIGDEMPLRYLDWIEGNRRKVDEATGGRCGYIHVPDVGARGINEFAKAFYAQIDKEALIVDSRWNAGGNFPSFFIELLRRQTIANYAPREGNDLRVPAAAINGPKVMLVNGYTSSAGDSFAYYFMKTNIGTVIGSRTMGATIGNVGTPRTIDNGSVQTSELALWEKVGGRRRGVIENSGVVPHIPIDNRPDLVSAGSDPQLEKSIEFIKQQLVRTAPAAKRPSNRH